MLCVCILVLLLQHVLTSSLFLHFSFIWLVDGCSTMYAADNDVESPPQFSFHRKQRMKQTVKCFIVTPSIQKFNPEFARVFAPTRLFDNSQQPM
jgi:hypothetical protein